MSFDISFDPQPNELHIEFGSLQNGIPLLSRSEWNSLSTDQKQAYGLVAIQDTYSGFDRGELIFGADYKNLNVIKAGTAGVSTSTTLETTGDYKLIVIAINSEASTYQLNIATAINGMALIGTDLSFNEYYSSRENQRNYRIALYDLSINAGDNLNISIANCSNYTSLAYVIFESSYLNISKELSSADTQTTGSNDQSGMVIYGKLASSSGGSINIERYKANWTIVTDYPGWNYASSYIFWFV